VVACYVIKQPQPTKSSNLVVEHPDPNPLRATPSESNPLPSHPIDNSQYWFKASEEDTALALVMERLILDDLKEQEQLNSSTA
jgi:hypothetical protein